MVQVELGTELEQQLAKTAAAKGLSLEEYLRRELGATRLVDDDSDPEKMARRREAIDRLLNFSREHDFMLGPDLTMKKLIDEGRRS